MGKIQIAAELLFQHPSCDVATILKGPPASRSSGLLSRFFVRFCQEVVIHTNRMQNREFLRVPNRKIAGTKELCTVFLSPWPGSMGNTFTPPGRVFK
jgi:hypothetical protein